MEKKTLEDLAQTLAILQLKHVKDDKVCGFIAKSSDAWPEMQIDKRTYSDPSLARQIVLIEQFSGIYLGNLYIATSATPTKNQLVFHYGKNLEMGLNELVLRNYLNFARYVEKGMNLVFHGVSTSHLVNIPFLSRDPGLFDRMTLGLQDRVPLDYVCVFLRDIL